jgi:hypothetical protein
MARASDSLSIVPAMHHPLEPKSDVLLCELGIPAIMAARNPILAFLAPYRNRQGNNKPGNKNNYGKRSGDKDADQNESEDKKKRARR